MRTMRNGRIWKIIDNNCFIKYLRESVQSFQLFRTGHTRSVILKILTQNTFHISKISACRSLFKKKDETSLSSIAVLCWRVARDLRAICSSVLCFIRINDIIFFVDFQSEVRGFFLLPSSYPFYRLASDLWTVARTSNISVWYGVWYPQEILTLSQN